MQTHTTQTPKSHISRFFELVEVLSKYDSESIWIHTPTTKDDPEIQKYDIVIDTPEGSFGLVINKIDRW